MPSFLLRVSLKMVKFSDDLRHSGEWTVPGDVLGQVERVDPDLLLVVVSQVGPGVATCSLLSRHLAPHIFHLQRGVWQLFSFYHLEFNFQYF